MARCVSETIRTDVTRTFARQVRTTGRRGVVCPRAGPIPARGSDLAVANVEGFVIDEQADQLGIGDVDDGLPGLWIAVAGLGVGERANSKTELR